MNTVTWSAEKYLPVNRCIYAEPGEIHAGPFGDEHIIPFGLLSKGGDWYLPKASCLGCADITHRFERTCLRQMLGPFRAQLDLKTRRKKERGTTVDALFIHPDDKVETRTMPYADFPRYCIGFRWDMPGILRGDPPGLNKPFGGETVVQFVPGELDKVVPDGSKLRLGRINMLDFARMLAKIAHTYAIAACGADKFDPLLLPLILGKSEDAAYLVGGDLAPLSTQPNMLHDVNAVAVSLVKDQLGWLAVSIRLFAFMNTPRYLVIVGRQLKPLDLPREKGPDGEDIRLAITI